MSTIRLRSAHLLVCATALHAPALADHVTYSGSVALQPVPWTATVGVPAFDPALGVLRAVTLTLGGTVTGTLALENTNAQTATVSYYPVAVIIATGPAGALYPSPNPAFELDGLAMQSFDGVLDFQGPSSYATSFAHSGGTGNPTVTIPIYVTSQLQAWVGTGGPVQLALDAHDATANPLTPGIAATHTLSAEAVYTVDYDYQALPASICVARFFSDCPCGTQLPAQDGCSNSVDPHGGALAASGQASIANDTLVLSGSGMTNSNALYFQGTAFTYQGAFFGDGARCVTGVIRRLGTKTNAGGASHFPAGGDPSISVQGGIVQPGTTRYYQVLYRDNGAFCTSATFNLTSGVALTWGA